MNLYTLALLALAMSADAFAAAVVKGTTLPKLSAGSIIRTALIFGAIETVAPLLGWAAGRSAQHLIESWDHWLAFALLAGLGTMMVRSGSKCTCTAEEKARRQSRNTLWMLLVTAVGTSIDSVAAGISLAFLDVHIVAAALAIGTATTLTTACGLLLGHASSAKMGCKAEIGGGIILIGIGCYILLQHLGLIA